MKTTIFALIVLIGYVLIGSPTVISESDEMPEQYPGSNLYGNNYRADQMNESALIDFLSTRNVKVVVRLNKDTGSLTVEQEADICDRLGIRFYYFNIEGDTKRVYNQIRNLFENGGVLLHCRHGYDRTGVIAGLWMKENGFTDSEIISANKWEGYLERKGEAYRKYYETVFTK